MLCLASVALAAETPAIRIRADAWMPYNGDPAASQPGFAVELVRTLFTARGYTVDYATMAWTDALRDARAGTIDAVIGANAKECEGLVRPSHAIGLPRIGFFSRKENPWKFTNVVALKTARLGAIEGYSYFDALDHFIRDNAAAITFYKGANGTAQAVADLSAGKIDVLPETASVFYWTLKELGKESSEFALSYLREGEPVYIAFTAQGDRGTVLARIFDEGVAEARKSGWFATLLERYRLSDW